MNSLLTLVEDNPLLKKWMNLCKLDQELQSFGDEVGSNFSNEVDAKVAVPSELSHYGSEFASINDDIKTLKALRAEEERLNSEIVHTQKELETAKTNRKYTIIAIVVMAVLAYLMFVAKR